MESSQTPRPQNESWLSIDQLLVGLGSSSSDELSCLDGLDPSALLPSDLLSTWEDGVHGRAESPSTSGVDSSSLGSCSPLSDCRWMENEVPSPTLPIIRGSNGSQRKRPRRGTATNKAALSARENRLKKKSYVECVEQQLQEKDAKNKQLMLIVGPLQEKITNLEKEVEYLKTVISNDSGIAAVLKNIPNLKEFRFAGAEPASRGNDPTSSSGSGGGVCLHVAGDNVSAVVCSSCSARV